MSSSKGNCDHHDHHHHHDSYGSAKLIEKPSTVFKIGISLNLIFVVVEVYYGFVIGSLSLVSDAFHNLLDVFGLMLAWLGYYLTNKSNQRKYSDTAAFINSTTLILASIWIVIEAVYRLKNPELPQAFIMMAVATIGFFINFFSARLFHGHHQHDLNMKSAYLHLMADAAVSLGVVVAGLMIHLFSVYWIDPVFSIIISAVIVVGAFKILKELKHQRKHREKHH